MRRCFVGWYGAAVCVPLWPLYYLWLGLRWLIPYPLWPLSKAWAADERLHDSFRSPPCVDRLRG